MSDPEDKSLDDDMIDPIEGLKQLEKLISEAKEYDSMQKVSFNGNKMLNDLLDKPIGSDNGEDDDDMPRDEGEDLEDETELIDEALDEVADEDKIRGLKRNNDEEEEDADESENDEPDEEMSTSPKSPKVTKTQRNRKSINTSSSKKKKKSTNPTLRKNIKSILKSKDLDKETQLARKEEEERIARQKERSHQMWQELQARQQGMQTLFGTSFNSMPNNMNALNQRFAEIPDEVLLSSDEDEERRNSNVESLLRQTQTFDRRTEVIDLSSSDDESSNNNNRTGFPNSAINLDYNMVGAYDDDDVAIIDNQEHSAAFIDANNCGSHTDDVHNIPDEEGRVLINVAHPPEDPDIYLAPQITERVKPHQIGGIRFLYDNVVESLERYKKSSGFGCILSHSMGLGKTMQVISFIDVFLSHTGGRHVLCIVPINTLQNWIHEFNMWLPSEDGSIDKFFKKKSETNEDVKYRKFKVFAINEAKSMTTRAKEILSWRKSGGVLLLGYEMYRILTSTNKNRSKKDEDVDPKLLNQINSEVMAALIDPGPDLVVCDEGHRIKNCNAATSQALKNIKTKRRIVLTGYPLQNKLMEYWCMVDFVRPNYLGLKNEFTNMFERPITNGQCIDSTEHDRRIMKFRAHVLYHMLKGFVQRRSHSVLQNALPVKCEYVIMCRMTKIQKALMLAFLDTAINDPDAIGTVKGRISTLTLFAVCCKVWNHPDIVYDIVRQGIISDDLDLEYNPAKNNRSQPRVKRKKVTNGSTSNAEPNDEMTINPFNDIPNHLFDTPLRNQRNDGVLDFSWAEDKLSDYTPGLIENSFKMVLLFEIIAECMEIGDRLLIFSQSLLTLDLIERFLQSREVPKTRNKWCKNQTYYRLDGSTSSHERERYINLFNNTETAHLFLISTRAGSLGINLIGANRIVIFDASWNPCHDAQAACRIYRYGQPKPCFIYRLVCDNSLEKKIYDRQVNKQGMANRVVDEQNVEANFTWREIHSLLDDLQNIVEPPVEVYGDDKLSKFGDDLIKKICVKFNDTITRLPFEHESLLLDRKEQKLSARERELALCHYQEAKRLKGHNMDFAHARAAMMNHHMGGRNIPNMNYPYQMPYQTSSPLPSQMTPTPQYMLNNMSHYPDAVQHLPPSPFPTQARGHNSNQFINFEAIAETLVRNGNTVKKVRIPNDLSINVGPNSSVTIKKGEEVMVIQTQKGLYLRTSDGNIISIKNNNPFGSQHFNSFTPISQLTKDSFGIVQPNLQCGGTVHCVTPSHSRASSTVSHPPEVVQLSDDEEECPEDPSIQTIDNTLDITQNITTASEQSIMTNGSTGDPTPLFLTKQNESTANSSAFESKTDSLYDSMTSTTPSSQLNNNSMSFETLEI